MTSENQPERKSETTYRGQRRASPLLGLTRAIHQGSKSLGINSASSATALISGYTISASIAFQIGYFLTIDYRLLWFFSLQDAITHALLFLPAAAVVFVLSFALSGILASDWATKLSTNAGQSESARKRHQRLFLYCGGAICVLSLLLFFFIDIRSVAVMTFLLGVQVILLSVVLSGHVSSELAVAKLLAFGGFFAVVFVAAGESRARHDLDSSIKNYRITVAGKVTEVHVLAAGSDIVVIRDDPRTVKLLPRTEITQMEVLAIGTHRPVLPLSILWSWAYESDVDVRLTGR